MDTLDDEWELSRETAHPNARRLMKAEFYWDILDEDSPFGNDTGADALEFYRAWIESNDDEDDFLDELFADWEVDRELAESVPDDALKDRLEADEFHILTYDDVVIAVAFAQLVLEGKTSKQMAAAAARSLKRQVHPAVMEFRNWSDPDERRQRCAQMLEALQGAT
jgi:uncharacterized protein YfeS